MIKARVGTRALSRASPVERFTSDMRVELKILGPQSLARSRSSTTRNLRHLEQML